METPKMDVFEAIKTTRAMRRLDPDRPVSDEDLWTILDAAVKGPSGSNRQPVRWLVVRDAAAKERLGELYREVWSGYQQDLSPERAADPQVAKNMASARHLADHLQDAPVLILPCSKRRGMLIEATVYPSVQNLMLAARALGLGTTLTTMLKAREAQVRELLGIPDEVEVFAVIPLGHPLGRWGEPPRRPAEEVTFWERWGSLSDRPRPQP